jgi:ribosomal protein S12 methylthiotransferase
MTHAPAPDRPATTVAVVSLGCARNDVDSEELAGRLEAGGFALVADADEADAVLVNTCGFVDVAKKDSVDTILAAADLKEEGRARAVVAVGCLAERYGVDLAESLPEADAVLGFDHYPQIADRVRDVLAGHAPVPHAPSDRRKLLPISPAERPAAGGDVVLPGHTVAAPDLPVGASPASGPRAVRRRLGQGPMAPLKLASGCDRRCTFCAIPSFRGSYVSRRPSDVLGEARWLAEQGVRELFLVSENSTSYGKDLGELTLLERLLPQLAAVDGVDRVRVSYLQPAETRPGLLDAIAGTEGIADYFDLSFQHASGPLLRRMRRFGDTESFLALLEQVRARAPQAGVRSNFIVGFPGETDHDFETLCRFVTEAHLDVVGVFGYSDEDGTEAETYDDKLDETEIAARVDHLSRLVEELTAQRAEDRVGEQLTVLVERAGHDDDGPEVEGRAEHQGPEVDGVTLLQLPDGQVPAVGDLVRAVAVAAEGVDLVARPSSDVGAASGSPPTRGPLSTGAGLGGRP